MAESILETLPRGSGRGYGQCENCKARYHNRSKPKFCDCGFFLEGKLDRKAKDIKVGCPPSVTV